MGREAICDCTFNGTTTKVKALLESEELILRGDIHLRAPLHALHHVRVESQSLCFNLDEGPIRLDLGAAVAKSWAKKIKTPPPSLADKLGITGKTVRTIGPISDRALDSALTSAAIISARNPDLILSYVDTARIPCHHAARGKGTTRPLHSHLARLPQRPRTSAQ